MISNETIKEFQKVIKDEYSIDLDYREADKVLKNLVAYFDLLAKIDHKRKINS
jgi:hypothetical protein